MERQRWWLGCGSWVVVALALAVAGCGPSEPAPSPAERPRNPALVNPTEEVTARLVERLLPPPGGPDANRQRYLNLIKLSLTDLLYENDQEGRRKRIEGWDWPSRAYTMIGLRRLNNVQECFEQVLENDVPGDLIEAGAWRGGATIYMRALLAAYGVTDRRVWVADSFEGLPPPDIENYPADEGLDLSNIDVLAVSKEQVQRNFRRYGLLDEQVIFLKGWFKDTLPEAPIDELAILRVDADLYESTRDALIHLYPKLSKGGCLIVDDYHIPACRKAVADYRNAHAVRAPIRKIDTMAVYWVKE